MEVISPGTVKEALSILKEGRKRLFLLSGGTDLLIGIKERIVHPQVLVDLSRLDELRYIEEEEESLRIGALTTIRALIESPLVKRYAAPLFQSAEVFGSPQIRNIATVGGNIVNASPVADTVPPLFVLDGTLTLLSLNGERKLSVEDFALAPGESVIRGDEILKEIRLRKMKNGEYGFFFKLGQRRSMTIAKVSVAFWAEIKGGSFGDVRIALGAVAKKVIRAHQAEAYLRGKEIRKATLEEASRMAAREATPITDLRSTREYRGNMVGALLFRGLSRLL